MPLAEKNNEIPTLPPLFKKTARPPGTLITADASRRHRLRNLIP
jgi:hypothetical protein